MGFFEIVKNIFAVRAPKSTALGRYEAFSRLLDDYLLAEKAVQSYSTRANSACTCERGENVSPTARDARVEKAVEQIYTETCLDGHTEAIDNLSGCYIRLTNGVALLDKKDELYGRAIDIFETVRIAFARSIEAYGIAAVYVKRSALEDLARAYKDEMRAMLEQLGASNPDCVDSEKARAEAEGALQASRVLAIKSKTLLNKAVSAESKTKSLAMEFDPAAADKEALRKLLVD